MKPTLFSFVIAACMIQSALFLSCNKGYYDLGSGATRCTQCYIGYE